MASFQLISLVLFSILVKNGLQWSYVDIANWNKTSAACGTGASQSPINIETTSAVYDAQLETDYPKFVNYNSAVTGDLINNGHTIQLAINKSIPVSQRPRLSGGGLGNNSYIFEQLHFHWGNSSTAFFGSEHSFDGKFSPAEIHLVHYNSKYPSFVEAMSHKDAFAVVGFLIDVIKTPLVSGSTDFAQITNLIPRIPIEGNNTWETFDFSKFLIGGAKNGSTAYYRYDGSLTTPPCSENVAWIMFEARPKMLIGALDAFRQTYVVEVDDMTHVERDYAIVNNFRPQQNLNGRIVRTNKPSITITSMAKQQKQQPQLATQPSTASGSSGSVSQQQGQQHSSGIKLQVDGRVTICLVIISSIALS